jgi:hypothetical protein
MGNDAKVKLYDSPQKTIKNWEALYEFYFERFTEPTIEWVFRGDNPDPDDKDVSHIPSGAFKSRLEKVFDYYEVKDKQRRKIEPDLIKAFGRKAHLYTDYRQENWLECLGLMQHYEAPTRMLDWTYSFFAAVYFAINRAEKDSCVVWALDSTWLAKKDKDLEDKFIRSHKNKKEKKRLRSLRGEPGNPFENKVIHYLIKKRNSPYLYAVNPYYLNERLSVQRGVLICPSKIDISWGENLERMLKRENVGKYYLWRIRIEWDNVEIQKQFLRRLYDMNISQASLFPDLDGFAKSLRTRVAMPETLGIFD